MHASTTAPLADAGSCKRPPSPHAAVVNALAKRARVERKPAAAEDAAELAALLLQAKAAHVLATNDPAAIVAAIEKEYSPRVAQLLARISAGLHAGKGPCDDAEWEDAFSGTDSDDAAVPGTSGRAVPVVAADAVALDDQCVPGGGAPFAARPLPPVVPVSDESCSEGEEDVSMGDAGDERDLVLGGEAYKKETEIALSRIFELGKVAAVVDPTIAPYAEYRGPSVVTMSGFGELGRFGNQVLQYAFLRVYQARHSVSEVQVPAWVGAGLFGLENRLVQRALPAVVETREAKANSTFTGEFMEYIKASNAGREVAEVQASDIGAAAAGGGVNVDFWGWFQWHTSCYEGHKSLIQDVFTPVPAIERSMTDTFNHQLRWRGGVRRTVVGLHLRLGDYQNIAASSFGYCAPTAWYLELLAKLWPTLENPVLFVASDELGAVLRDFAAFQPLTADDVGIVLPESAAGLRAGFFPDWWSLTQCDVLAISNSTFSFTACMMNKVPGARFYRAHYADRMVAFDPWDADPIVHRDMSGGGISTAVDTLKVVYNTQGTRGLVRNVLYELPYYGIRSAIMRAVLWKNARANQAALCAKEAAV
jgi:hypothetical protein